MTTYRKESMDPIGQAAQVHSALSLPVRLRILLDLHAQGPTTVGEVVRWSGLSQPVVSRHLRLLYGAGLLARERRGSYTYYGPIPSGELDGARAAARETLSVLTVALEQEGGMP